MEKEILDALKTRYKTLGFGEKAFGGVAALLAKTITDAKDIESAVAADEVANLLKAFQGEKDVLRTEKSALEKSFNAYKEQHPAEEKQEKDSKESDGEESEVLKLLKQMQSENTALKERMDKQDAAARRASFVESAKSSLKAEGKNYNNTVVDLILKQVPVGAEDTAETFLATCKSELDALGDGALNRGVVPSFGDYKPQEGYRKGMNSAVQAALRASHPDSFAKDSE